MKSVLDQYKINIQSKTPGIYHEQWLINDVFFNALPQQIVNHGNVQININLQISQSKIEAMLYISGTVELICDRSMQPFSQTVSGVVPVSIMIGTNDNEIDANIFTISQNTTFIDFAPIIFDNIATMIPMKKIHPSLQEEDDSLPGDKLVYTTLHTDDAIDTDQYIDPRWEQLKKLKDIS
ncbi:MAG: DUF177 domain-containing protein [Cytophagales bacterium]|nr:DUF177 domain-containing protein [Cytophagales bacterium]